MIVGYMVTCKLKNGNVISSFAGTFSSAMHVADMFINSEFTERVEVIKISTGATTRYVF